MKTIVNLIVLLLIGFAACEKEEDRVILLGNSKIVLTVSSAADLVLEKSKSGYRSLQFQWTNPNYEFSNGSNTQDIKYALQIDTLTTFSSAKKYETGFSNLLSTEYLVKDLNSILGVLEMKDGVPHLFYFRIKATVGKEAAPVYSNVIAIKITTYLEVLYPVPEKLYMIGAATPYGWTNDAGLEVQRLSMLNAYTFVIHNIALKPDGFLFIPLAGDWKEKYGFTGKKQENNAAGDTFQPNGEDFQGPSSGNYKVTVNFKTGKYALEKM